MQNEVLLSAAILLPTLSALFCYFIKNGKVRSFIVGLSALLLFAVAGGFAWSLFSSGGSIRVSVEHSTIGMYIGWVIKLLDLILMGYIISIGLKLKKPLVIVLALLQLIPMLLFEVFGGVVEPEFAFTIDYLSLVMILLVSIIGPIITIFALGYMKEHEHHLHLKVSRQPRFFMVLFIFIAAMNALVVTNDLMWMYFFWEVTTLCSFLLISHDGNEQAVKNALRALCINLFGGIGFIAGIIITYKVTGTLSIEEILQTKEFVGLLPVGIALLCFAGFTKSAQFPFQSWLLGAMVAPTPVSALLHSSTMVKAGVYLVVRFSPLYAGSLLGKMIAVVGGFTFLAGSAVAISQSNGKKVLAYSTIANLGLIVCCAGLGSHVAIGAAMLLMIFHAVSKGLLFLCVGTVELGIGSRDIEDMQGLMKRMPFTATIMVIGMISMLLPPFGVLITKWLAIEAAVTTPVVLVLIILGSAFTVVFWSQWIGIVLTMSYKAKHTVEKLSMSMKSMLALMLAGVFAASIGIVPLFNHLINPQLEAFGVNGNMTLAGEAAGIVLNGASDSVMGGFASIPFFVVFLLLMAGIGIYMSKTKAESIRTPYLCGANADDTDVRGLEFISPGDKVETVVVRNYYLSGFFGENKMTLWLNLAAVAIILVMFGVVV